MTDFVQELGATAPRTAMLLSRSAWVAVSAFLLIGLWTLCLCGVEALQTVRGALAQRLRRVRPSLRRARVAQAEDEIERAFLILCRILKRNPQDYEASLAMWEVARDAGHPERAEQAMLAAIRHELASGDGDSALRHWLALLGSGYEISIEPELLVRLVGLLRAANQERACAATLRGALDAAADTRALTELARVCAELDRETAEEAAWQALSRPDLKPAARGALLELLKRLYPAEAGRAELLVVEAGSGRAARARSEERQRGARGPSAPTGEPEPGAAPGLAASPPAPERPARILEALPLEFDAGALRVEVPEVGKKRVRFCAVDAIAVAAVRGLASGPVVVIDLLLNWAAGPQEPLRVVRLRSDRFKASRFAPEAGSSPAALRTFLRELLARTGARPLPGRLATLGQPFAAFAGLERYQRDVLRIGAATAPVAPAPPA